MGETIRVAGFEWNREKSEANEIKHGIKFLEAMLVFLDHERITRLDFKHSVVENRWISIGMIGDQVATVRYSYREGFIRIIGAGYWRKGRKEYEEKNKIKN